GGAARPSARPRRGRLLPRPAVRGPRPRPARPHRRPRPRRHPAALPAHAPRRLLHLFPRHDPPRGGPRMTVTTHPEAVTRERRTGRTPAVPAELVEAVRVRLARAGAEPTAARVAAALRAERAVIGDAE